MKKGLKYTLFIVFLCLFVAGTGVLYGVSREKRRERTCERVEVRIRDKYRFVDEDEIKGYLQKGFGSIWGTRIDSVDLSGIEKYIESKSAVRKCEAWCSSDGCLHLDITQRVPAIKFKLDDYSFYADREGFAFPLGNDSKIDVPQVGGSLPLKVSRQQRGEFGSEKERVWVMSVLDLLDRLEDSKEFRGRLEGLSVRRDGDLVLKLKDCNALFIIGEPVDIDGKIKGMSRYFSHIEPDKGKGYYKSVNLKFNKQIICRRDI